MLQGWRHLTNETHVCYKTQKEQHLKASLHDNVQNNNTFSYIRWNSFCKLDRIKFRMTGVDLKWL